MTGASGFLGSQLLPRLINRGAKTLVVGRQATGSCNAEPAEDYTTYKDLVSVAIGHNRLLHLAVVNNNVEATEEAFFQVNSELTRKIAEDARSVGVPVFVNFSSFHALPDGPDTHYSRSKRAGIEALANVDGIKIINLFLPAVYGDSYAGKLALLKNMPGLIQPFVLTVLTSLAPTVHIDRIAEFVTQDLEAIPTGEWVFLADPQEENWIYRFVRKLIDYGFAVAVMLFFWWLLLIVWFLVKTGSEGPGIFAQERVGKEGNIFTCYKFRTMSKDTRQAGTHEISESAVTPFGAILRRTKIDELPQVWNILKGELSLVGPRPCLPVQEELVTERKKRGVLDILPGITGLAQVQGIDMSDPVRLARKDAEYIARRGLLLDIKIVLGTFLGRGQGDRTEK